MATILHFEDQRRLYKVDSSQDVYLWLHRHLATKNSSSNGEMKMKRRRKNEEDSDSNGKNEDGRGALLTIPNLQLQKRLSKTKRSRLKLF